jgi:hypothetical protein
MVLYRNTVLKEQKGRHKRAGRPSAFLKAGFTSLKVYNRSIAIINNRTSQIQSKPMIALAQRFANGMLLICGDRPWIGYILPDVLLHRS